MKRSIGSMLGLFRALVPQAALKVDTNGASFDKTAQPGFEALTMLVHLGASGDTLSGSVFIELEMEESDDDSVWNKVANADMSVPDATQKGTEGDGVWQKVDDPSEDDVIYKADYIGHKKFARLVLDFTGTHTNGIDLSASYVAGRALGEPVANQ